MVCRGALGGFALVLAEASSARLNKPTILKKDNISLEIHWTDFAIFCVETRLDPNQSLLRFTEKFAVRVKLCRTFQCNFKYAKIWDVINFRF